MKQIYHRVWKQWGPKNFNMKVLSKKSDLDLKVMYGGGDGTVKNSGPVSIIIPNMNQIHHRDWKQWGPKNFNAKL